MPKQTKLIKPPKNRPFLALGLMSGTSMDGIDVALLETDGQVQAKPKGFMSFPYSAAFRKKLRSVLGQKKAPAVEKEITALHAKAVKAFLKKKKLKPVQIDIIGFHGHTIFHAPEKGITVQLGDGHALARAARIPVIYDFRSDDVKAGGQGAPLVPIYHQALAGRLKKPVAFLNIGGVANITFIGRDGALLAFDTGPGGALLDDWVLAHTSKPFDKDGKLAEKGNVEISFIKEFLRHPYFQKPAPKSLDRDAFINFIPTHLNVEDGAATLTLMAVLGVVQGLELLPEKPKQIIVSGGGRKNKALMKMLAYFSGIKTVPIEKLGLQGDATEAEAFAYLAVRTALGLPISFLGTTGRKQ